MPSIVNSNAGPQSNRTWLSAAKRVARSVGGFSDPGIIEAAKDALQETIQDWNTEKDWQFLQVIAPDITLTTNSTRYPLPTNFKKPYDAYLKSSQIKLEYVQARYADTILPGGGTFPISAYSLYNVGTTGEIEVLPSSTSDILVVRYFRPIQEDYIETDLLDLPSRYVSGVLAGARSLLCADAKDYIGSKFWGERALARLAWAKRDDDRIPDEELRFTSAASAVNLTRVDTLEDEL